MAGKRRRDAHIEEDRSLDTTHPSRKRRVEYTESDAKIASYYNDLSDDVKTIRLKAAAELIRSLTDTEPEKLDKALTRLIRGLCSSRKAARSGFSVALTEVFRLTLKHAEATSGGLDLALPSLIDRVLSTTTPDAKSNSQERRDYLLGRCFGLKSLIQSQLVFQKNVSVTEWEKVLNLIFQLATETLWLRRECGVTLYETLLTLSQIPDVDAQYATLLMSKLDEYKLTKTPEGLAIWLTAVRLFPALSLPKGVWNHNDPLSGNDRAVVAKVLRDNSTDEPGAVRATGAAQTSPSFAWQIVLTQLYGRQKSSKKDNDFDKFWIEAVDNGLFASSASDERKALGMQVIILGVVSAPKELLGSIFSPNVMRCIVNHRVDSNRYLHEAAKVPLLQAVARGKADHEAIPPMLEAFLSEKGSVDFDKLTKTKTVEELIKRVKNDSARDVLRIIRGLIINPGTSDQQQAENRRRMLADMLLVMARSRQLGTDDDYKSAPLLSSCLTMGDFAYGDASIGGTGGRDKMSPPLSESTQDVFRSRLMSSLNHAMSCHLDDDFLMLDTVVSHVRDVDKMSPSGLRTRVDKQVLKIIKKAHDTLTELRKVEKKDKESNKPAVRAFKALFGLSILQAFNAEADIVGVIEDLEMAYQSWQKNTDATVMLIEILLSFISKPSSVYRKLAQQVFGAFAAQMNSDGLQSMIDILDKKENLSGQQELFENGDDVEEGAEDEGIDGEDDSDVEMIDGEDASDVEVEEAGNSNEEEDEEESEGSDDEEDVTNEDADFERKLTEALRTSKAGADSKEVDSDDDSDMNDEQMMALDGHLTTIFKERKKTSNRKQDNKDAKENIVNFKIRVLDLLLIFAKQEHAKYLVLELVLPMITLIRTTSSKQISEKAFNLLHQYFAACSKSKVFPIPEDGAELVELISVIHGHMHANASKVHSNACSRSSLFLAKILVNKDAKFYDDIANLYSSLQKEWYHDPKSHIQARIFTEWTSWSIATRKQQQ